jgi:hypothetical protein
MFGDSQDKKKSPENQGIPKSSPRGNMDEYEAVRSIVSSDPGLLSRVLEKIRSHRASKSGDSKSQVKNNGQEKK